MHRKMPQKRIEKLDELCIAFGMSNNIYPKIVRKYADRLIASESARFNPTRYGRIGSCEFEKAAREAELDFLQLHGRLVSCLRNKMFLF